MLARSKADGGGAVKEKGEGEGGKMSESKGGETMVAEQGRISRSISIAPVSPQKTQDSWDHLGGSLLLK